MFYLPEGVDCRGSYELGLWQRLQQTVSDIKVEREWRHRVERNAQLKDRVERAIRRYCA